MTLAQSFSKPADAFDFAYAREQWSRPPFDNIGYLASEEVLTRTDEQIRDIVRQCEANRYALESDDGLVRNHKNRWRAAFGLDSTVGKRVLDFGCGMGIEALQFARARNRVILADIAPANTRLAAKVLELFGAPAETAVTVSGEAPFFAIDGQIDIFYSNGVLHHTPRIAQILRRAHQVLRPDGEARLMLYSDKGWTHFVGELPSVDADVSKHPGFETFVRAFDSVGGYADWYNPEKIRRVAGPFFDLVHFEYVTKPQWYCAAILKRI